MRTWTADVANGAHRNREWHSYAETWQTPGDGEAYFDAVLALPLETVAEAYEGFHVGHDDALTLASWADATMGSCILDLYRSAVPNVFATWGDKFGPSAVPGLVIYPEFDSFAVENKSHEAAIMLGAREETLRDVGHWWVLEQPAAAAKVIKEFINNVG